MVKIWGKYSRKIQCVFFSLLFRLCFFVLYLMFCSLLFKYIIFSKYMKVDMRFAPSLYINFFIHRDYIIIMWKSWFPKFLSKNNYKRDSIKTLYFCPLQYSLFYCLVTRTELTSTATPPHPKFLSKITICAKV